MRDFSRMIRCSHCSNKIFVNTYIGIDEVIAMTGFHYNTIVRHCEDFGGKKVFGKWKFPLAKVVQVMEAK